jgi:hypothetical protein
MKTKAPVSIKKQSVTVKDLKTKKNPKGGGAAAALKITGQLNDCNTMIQGGSGAFATNRS